MTVIEVAALCTVLALIVAWSVLRKPSPDADPGERRRWVIWQVIGLIAAVGVLVRALLV